MALSAKVKAAVKRGDILRSLLSEFDVELCSHDSKICGTIRSNRPESAWHLWSLKNFLTFDEVEWLWLEPLLMELRDLRKYKYG